jgi:hypothetical protein
MRVNALRVVRGGALVAIISAVAVSGTAAPVPAERAKAEKELAALGTKLHGTWRGDAGCVGNVTFRADGTYEWTGRGPVGQRDAGTWALRSEGQTPVLILKCKTSSHKVHAGTTVEVRLALEGSSLAFQSADPQSSQTFTRLKEPREP